MVSGKAVVINEKGLHIKPAGKMSSIALSYPCMAYLVIREYRVNAKSVLGILSAQVKKGEEIEVSATARARRTRFASFWQRSRRDLTSRKRRQILTKIYV